MGISQTAVARGTGISAEFTPRTGGAAQNLPAQLMLVGQSQDGTSAIAPFQVTGGPKEVGQKCGFKSPLYSMVREIYPTTGGGAGGIPVWVFPLDAGAGATAASGDISATGSAVSKASTFTPIIGGVRCRRFTVAKYVSVGAPELSDIYEDLRQSIEATLGVVCTVAHEYGIVTDTAGGSNAGDGALTAAVTSGGAPKAGTWTLTCTSAAADAGDFDVVDPDGFSVGTVTADAGLTAVAGLDLTLTDGAADFEVGDTFSVEVPSSKLNVTVAFKGSSGNQIELEVEGPTDVGLTWAYTVMSGGATNPSVQTALDLVGQKWLNFGVNQFEAADTTNLDLYQAWVGDPEDETGRWAPTVRKPAVFLTGNNDQTVADATVESNTRTDDLANVFANVPDSNNPSWVIAAAHALQVAKLANDNPPHDYGSKRMTTLNAGEDQYEWDGDARELAVQRGASTTQVKDGVVEVSDVVTPYSPDGEDPPAYRFVVDQVKVWNVIYNYGLVFDSDAWDGKPLIATGQATVNPEARTVASAKGASDAILDQLALSAVIADPSAAKKATTVQINPTNPKRLDIVPRFALAGNTNIKDISLKFGFFYG